MKLNFTVHSAHWGTATRLAKVKDVEVSATIAAFHVVLASDHGSSLSLTWENPAEAREAEKTFKPGSSHVWNV